MNAGSVNASNFLEIVQMAFFDSNQQTRSRHEAALTNCMTTDPNLFVMLCTNFFNKDDVNLQLRVTIATILKLALKPTKGNELLSIWNKINQETKRTVQETGLMNLVDDNEAIKNASASLVADVFACDCLFEKKWTNLLPNLRNNLNHEDPNVQKSAILTLGYICEVLHQENITSLTDEQVDAMITGICLGLKQYDDKTITALKALENSINFLNESIRKETVSDFIMNLLMSIHIEALKVGDAKVIRQNLLCLNEICPRIYGSFAKYHEIVFKNVILAAGIDDKDVLIVLNEFILTILTKEKLNPNFRFFRNFVVSALEKILEALILRLPEEFEFNEPDEKLDILESSLQAMTAINSLYLDLSFDPLMKIISIYIEKPDDVSKSVALLALESMLEVPPNQKVYNTLFSVFHGVTLFFSKNNLRIKMLTGSILSKIAKFYPGIFMEDRNFATVFPILMSQFHQQPRNFNVCQFVCNTFDNVSNNFSKLAPHAKSQLIVNHEPVIENLLNSVNSQGVSLFYIDLVYGTIMNLLQWVVPHENLSRWFIFFWDAFLKLKNTLHDELTKAKIDSIFINLNIIVQTIILNNKRLILGDNHNEQLSTIYNEVIKVFQTLNEMRPELLLFLVSMIELENQVYQPQIEIFMREYLGRAIEQKTQPELFQVGITCMGHLVKIYGKSMEPYMQKLLPFIIESLADPAMRKETKIHMFFTVADISAHCPQATYSNLQKILNLLEMAFSAVIQLQQSQDPENEQYTQSLKETLVDMILCIVHGIFYQDNESNESILLRQFLPKVVEFVKLTTGPHAKSHIGYNRDVLMLLMDISLRDKNFELIDQSLLVGLYRELSNHTHLPDIQETLTEVKKYIFKNSDPLNQGNFA